MQKDTVTDEDFAEFYKKEIASKKSLHEINPAKEILIGKNKISGKLFIIIGIVIGLIFISVIVIVIVLANTKKKNHLFLEMILMIQEFFQMILM